MRFYGLGEHVRANNFARTRIFCLNITAGSMQIRSGTWHVEPRVRHFGEDDEGEINKLRNIFKFQTKNRVSVQL